ncbi:MAG: glycosyltransferase family 2 protein, partial [Anaerolineales bacterium]|nr:glycosyltransferase family 2 protein [Anaerolineales bacterium]
MASKGSVTFSVAIPVYNEVESLPELYPRICAVMDDLGESWELILIDDGSSDGSTNIIRSLAANDERVQPVFFARNFGHQIAITAGLDHSRGQAVVIMDADLQDPPEVIIDLVAKWREGYEVVYA